MQIVLNLHPVDGPDRGQRLFEVLDVVRDRCLVEPRENGGQFGGVGCCFGCLIDVSDRSLISLPSYLTMTGASRQRGVAFRERGRR